MSKQAVHWVLIVSALLSATALAPVRALAQEDRISAQVSLDYTNSDIESENTDEASSAFGQTTDTEFTWFKERYNLELRKELYPHLSLFGGGYLELVDSQTDTNGLKTGQKERADRLFAELDLDNPMYTASGAYRRRNFKTDPRNLASSSFSREEYSALWRWRPIGFPAVDLDYNRFRTWDDAGSRDRLVNLLVLKSRYSYRDLVSDYTYTRNEQDERIRKSGTLTQIHNGGLRYPKSFLDDRLEISGAARINYETLKPQATGDVLLPTDSPGAAFFLLDDSDPSGLTPVDPANPLTTVNIGRNGPATDVAVGLDFAGPTEVDTIHVMPLEDLTDPTLASPAEIAAVAGSFVWTVYTSDDQLTWTEQLVSSAVYNIFDNRFEIVLVTRVEAEFIKVVTTPLTSATKEIRIQRLQSFETVPGAPGLEIENLTQIYNLGAQWAATEKTTASYDTRLRIRQNEPFGTRTTSLTNSVDVQHDFNPIFSGNARFLRTDVLDTEKVDTVRHTYTASLTGDYLPSLSQRLVYSGSHSSEGGRSGFSNSILLRTNAFLYRDWGINLDLGYRASELARGGKSSSANLRFSTNIAPNDKLRFAILYQGSYDTGSNRPSGFSHTGRFQGSWVPTRTLSLFASVSLRDDARDDKGLRDSQNYAVNWSPLLDGQLAFTLAYNQSVSMSNQEIKTITPRVNWQVTRTTLLTVGYEYGTLESDTQTRELKVLQLNFRTMY